MRFLGHRNSRSWLSCASRALKCQYYIRASPAATPPYCSSSLSRAIFDDTREDFGMAEKIISLLDGYSFGLYLMPANGAILDGAAFSSITRQKSFHTSASLAQLPERPSLSRSFRGLPRLMMIIFDFVLLLASVYAISLVWFSLGQALRRKALNFYFYLRITFDYGNTVIIDNYLIHWVLCYFRFGRLWFDSGRECYAGLPLILMIETFGLFISIK